MPVTTREGGIVIVDKGIDVVVEVEKGVNSVITNTAYSGIGEAPKDDKYYSRQNMIWVESPGASGGEANTLLNTGTGEGTLPGTKVGAKLGIKSIKAGGGISVSETADEVIIDTAPLLMPVPLLNIPLKNSLEMVEGVGSVTFTRPSSATYVDRYGVLQHAAIDEPRFEKEGLLIEGESTNQCLESQDLSGANWWHSDGHATSAYGIAPDGTQTSSLVHFNSADAIVRDTISGITGEVISAFTWVKGTLGETIVVCRTYPGAYELTTLTGEWQKILSEGITASTDSFDIIGTGLGATARDVEVWGAQLEELPFASSYIPTTDSPVTRDADVCSVDFENNTPPPYESFSFLIDFSLNGQNSSSWPSLFRVDGESERQLGIKPGGDVFIKNGVSSITIEAYSQPSRYGFISGPDGSPTVGYSNGVMTVTGTQSVATGTGTNIELGTQFLFGHISNFKIYDKALTEAQMRVA